MYKNVIEFIGDDFPRIVKLKNNAIIDASSVETEKAMRSKTRGQFFFIEDGLDCSSGSCVIDQSNVRVFARRHRHLKSVRVIRHDNGNQSIAVDITCSSKKIIKDLMVVRECLPLDAEDLAKLEREIEDKAWDQYLRNGFIAALKKKFNSISGLADMKQLKTLYEALKTKTGLAPDIDTLEHRFAIYLEKLVEQLEELPDFNN